MRKDNIIRRIFCRYFDDSIEVEVQFFNLLSFVGIIAGLFIAALSLFLHEQPIAIIIDVAISLLALALLLIAEKTKAYRLSCWILVVVVFLIMFPLIFVKFGGYMTGVSSFLILAIIFTGHMLEKKDRVVALALESVIYIACCAVVYYYPDVSVLPDRTVVLEVILNFILSGTLIMFIIMLRSRMLRLRHEQTEELNRELTARNETLALYDNMKSDFLATVAHEINTPLAVISASSNDTLDLLKETPLNMDEIISNQQLIERRVKLIDSILLDLMDTVAIENGRLTLSRQPVSLAHLITSVCGAQYKKMDTNFNSLMYDLQPDLPDIWLDPSRIEQVLTNFLSNAFRHTQGGTVIIKLIRANGNQIVSVTDNGEGMDAEMARIALKSYVSTKADYWRHGIGLYICRRIIAAHGGDIWLESEKGRGTCVSFMLKEDTGYE